MTSKISSAQSDHKASMQNHRTRGVLRVIENQAHVGDQSLGQFSKLCPQTKKQQNKIPEAVKNDLKATIISKISEIQHQLDRNSENDFISDSDESEPEFDNEYYQIMEKIKPKTDKFDVISPTTTTNNNNHYTEEMDELFIRHTVEAKETTSRGTFYSFLKDNNSRGRDI